MDKRQTLGVNTVRKSKPLTSINTPVLKPRPSPGMALLQPVPGSHKPAPRFLMATHSVQSCLCSDSCAFFPPCH